MTRNSWWDTLSQFFKENLLSLGIFLVVLGLLLYGLSTAQSSKSQEELSMVQQSIARAVVCCYAIEGVYPESFSYLQEHYALSIDQSKYFIEYNAFASNIMPEVTVIEVSP